MDRFQQIVGLRSDDRAALDLLPVWSGPRLPQPGKAERLPTLQDDVNGPLPSARLLPLSYVDMSSVVRTEPSRVLPKLPNWEDRS